MYYGWMPKSNWSSNDGALRLPPPTAGPPGALKLPPAGGFAEVPGHLSQISTSSTVGAQELPLPTAGPPGAPRLPLAGSLAEPSAHLSQTISSSTAIGTQDVPPPSVFMQPSPAKAQAQAQAQAQAPFDAPNHTMPAVQGALMLPLTHAVTETQARSDQTPDPALMPTVTVSDTNQGAPGLPP